MVSENARFRVSLTDFEARAWAKCDFWTKLLTKADFIGDGQASQQRLVEEVGGGVVVNEQGTGKGSHK